LRTAAYALTHRFYVAAVRLALVAAALALLVPAASAAPNGTVTRGSVQVDGLTRTYRVFVPARPKKPAPVVLVFHGGFGTGARVATQTGFDAEAEKRGFIAVYPDGVGRAWNAGPCCGAPSRLGVNDVGFVSKLLDKLGRRYAIDKRRIYATGISNGGLISYRVACELSNRIAAVAPVATTLVSRCSPRKAVSILHVHGLEDANIPFEGGQGTRGVVDLEWPPVEQGIELWRKLDGCPAAGAATVGPVISMTVWTPCRSGTEVRLVTIAGVGHVWPKEPYSATSEIWRFFAAHGRQ
jgi:polyhydroxybutyrate depolymerase